MSSGEFTPFSSFFFLSPFVLWGFAFPVLGAIAHASYENLLTESYTWIGNSTEFPTELNLKLSNKKCLRQHVNSFTHLFHRLYCPLNYNFEHWQIQNLKLKAAIRNSRSSRKASNAIQLIFNFIERDIKAEVWMKETEWWKLKIKRKLERGFECL